MGRLGKKRSKKPSLVKYVETQSRRGPAIREQVLVSSPLKRKASTSPSKLRYPTPNTGGNLNIAENESGVSRGTRLFRKVRVASEKNDKGS